MHSTNPRLAASKVWVSKNKARKRSGGVGRRSSDALTKSPGKFSAAAQQAPAAAPAATAAVGGGASTRHARTQPSRSSSSSCSHKNKRIVRAVEPELQPRLVASRPCCALCAAAAAFLCAAAGVASSSARPMSGVGSRCADSLRARRCEGLFARRECSRTLRLRRPATAPPDADSASSGGRRGASSPAALKITTCQIYPLRRSSDLTWLRSRTCLAAVSRRLAAPSSVAWRRLLRLPTKRGKSRPR